MPVSDLEAVCRSEAQRVLTCLRGNRRHGGLHRSWRELEESSPIRQLSEWRSHHEAAPTALLLPLLQIVRSPDFAGPPTYVALEAAQALVVALCEVPENGLDERGLAGILVEVCTTVCECVFEETNAQVDEATAMQMIAVLAFCATSRAGADAAFFPSDTRLQAFSKILDLWGHYRHSPALRACAQAALQRMLDFACADLPAQAEFVGAVLSRLSDEVKSTVPVDRVLLYLRCLQRLMTHPAARQWSVTDGSVATFFQDSVPLALLRIGEHFSNSISVLSLLLPIVNRMCWLCVDHWAAADEPEGESRQSLCLGALQVESLMSSIYLRSLTRAVAPLKSAAVTADGGLTPEEGAELLVVLLEGLCDFLRADVVRTLWISFDADWRRPPLLQQVIECIVVLFHDAPSTERPLPAHLVHLSSTVLARIVGAFAAMGANACEDAEELSAVKDNWRKREDVLKFVEKFEESPKKGRQALEKSGVLDFVPLPPKLPNTMQDPPFEDWALKMAWIFRVMNYCAPYSAMGEYFGQPFGKGKPPDSQLAGRAYVDTFNLGPVGMVEAIRCFLQSFLLPKEGQQIDRVLETFAHCYYRKHIDHAKVNDLTNSTYLRSLDASHTLAFSIIMLNTDQHNPKLPKRGRMTLSAFLNNNRGINDGENIPEEVQTRIFESIHGKEIQTPSSGSLAEGILVERWMDFMQLIRQGYRDNALSGQLSARTLGAHAQVFLERMGENVRTALEHALATDAGAYSDALEGLEQLLRLTVQCRRPEADGVAEGLFFFGTEVFHEPQPAVPLGRAAACLRALFRTALVRLTNMSTKQLHMMVYLTAQFALYGLFERALPASDPITAKLLRAPSLVVDPPTGVVYSFLRKISTAPFKMLSYAEEGSSDERKTKGPDGAPSGSPRSSPRDDPEGASQEPAASPPASSPQAATSAASLATEENGRGDDSSSKATSNPENAAVDEASLHDDPLRPQIEKAFEACDLNSFIQTLVQLWQPHVTGGGGNDHLEEPGLGAAQTFLGYLSSLFLALRSAGTGKVGKDQDLPWWPEPPAFTCMTTPQALQLPKRALSLNVLDGYETLRLALRLMTATLGAAAPATIGERRSTASQAWEPCALQELSVCAHIGLFHTLRRGDLCERTLRVAIAGLFQAGAILLAARSPEGPVVSIGWPVRLIGELLRRTEGEPQLLVPTARLCLEAVRAFVAEVSPARPLDRLELWKALLLLLLKAIPTPARALWPGTKDREVEAIQGQLWRHGVVWLLGHPQLLRCLGAEGGAAAAGERGPSAEGGGGFWAWALGELAALAQEIAAGSRPTATRLLLEAYGTLLGSIARVQSAEEYAALDDDSAEPLTLGRQASREPASPPCAGGANGTAERIMADERSAAWSRVAISLLTYVGPSLGKPTTDDNELHPVLLLKQEMLNVRVPPLLSASAQGPYWARIVLEKLISSLTGDVSSGAPLSVVRESVSLVAKFFLQNLDPLRRPDGFIDKMWLMVLRLMLLFIQRGTNDRDTELEEIATETLKNLLCVLLSTRTLGYVAPKDRKMPAGGAGATAATQQGQAGAAQEEVLAPPVWWQMTWDSIQYFLPGFGEELVKSMPEVGGTDFEVSVPTPLQPLPEAPPAEKPVVTEEATVAPEVPLTEAPAAEPPAETPAVEALTAEVTEVVAAEAPTEEAPMAQAPAAEVPTAEVPPAEALAEAPVVEARVVEAPAVEATVVEAPVAEVPAAEAPVTEAPGTEAPAVEAQVVEAPAVEAPVVNDPSAEALTVEALSVEIPMVEAPLAEAPAQEPAAEELAGEVPAEEPLAAMASEPREPAAEGEEEPSTAPAPQAAEPAELPKEPAPQALQGAKALRATSAASVPKGGSKAGTAGNELAAVLEKRRRASEAAEMAEKARPAQEVAEGA